MIPLMLMKKYILSGAAYLLLIGKKRSNPRASVQPPHRKLE